MTDVLLTTLVLCLVVAVACLLGFLLLVVPFVLTVDQAERRGFASFRWGAASSVGGLLMLALTYLVLTHDWSKLLLLPVVLFPWIAFTAVSLLAPEDRRFGGLVGAHQR